VTYLEAPGQEAPRAATAAAASWLLLPPAGAEVRRIAPPTVAGYRFLYESVGEPWLWHERRLLSDPALAAIIGHPRIDLLGLTIDQRIAGFAELDGRRSPDIKLAYFGLLPRFIGRGIGPWLLAQVLEQARRAGPRRLLVNTCSFDHPAALPLYRRFGFEPVRSVVREILDPRLTGLLPRHAAPHIPLARGADAE
jgi:GNAT superfamily N-acetyltransferase